MKRKLLFVAAVVASALGFNANAQTTPSPGDEVLVNGSFDTENQGWTLANMGYQVNGERPTRYVEKWEGNGIKQSGSASQTVSSLPAGVYTFTGMANTRVNEGDNVKISVDDQSVNVSAGWNNYVIIYDHKSEGDITVKFEYTAPLTSDWVAIDDFSLVYEGTIQQCLQRSRAAAQELYDKPMNAGVLAALKTAIANEDETLDNAKTIREAIFAAEQSIALYENSKAAIDAMNELLASTNIYTVDAKKTYMDLAAKYLASYESRELVEAVVNPFTVTGHRANPLAASDLLISAWDVNAYNWDSYHVNTWSTEGNNDGSDFKVPFIEYWTNDDKALGAKKLTATIEGLSAGEYEVSAWVRVRAKDGTDATAATGITLSVNEGEAVDVTEGTKVGNTQFSLAEYTAKGTVGEDGELVITFDVAADNNISWLAFQNVKYTKQPTVIEIGNYAFDENEDDIVTVTTQGYGKNISGDQKAGLQPVQAWTPNPAEPNMAPEGGAGYTGGVFKYGSTNKNNNTATAPAQDPEGNSDGVALALSAVWSGTAQYTQEVTLPAGNYVITYPVYNGAGTNAFTKSLFGFIADDGTEYLSDKKSFKVGEWETDQVEFTLYQKTTGKISVGFVAINNGTAANQHLFVDRVEVVQQSEVELTDAQTNLLNKLESLSPVGEGILRYKEDEIAAAKAAIQSAATQAEIDAVKMPTVTPPVEGVPYIFTLSTSNGLQLSKNGTDENKACVSEEGKLIYLVAQGNGKYAISLGEGEYFNYSPNDAKNWWTVAVVSNAYGWTINALPNGTYTIEGDANHENRANNAKYLGTNDFTDDKTCYGDKKDTDANIYWNIAEYAPTVTVTGAGWATYVTPVAVDFGEEITAYVVQEVADAEDDAVSKKVAKLVKIDAAPANTPVVIEAEADTYTLSAVAEADKVDNILEYAEEEKTDVTNIFVLANLDNTPGFYALKADVTSLPAGTVYLSYSVNGVKFIGFDGYEYDATAIKGVETPATAVENGIYYNLSGQRVQAPTKGIYIVNGKKVLVK